MSITKLDQLLEVVKTKPKKRLVAAFANDEHTIEAVYRAIEAGIVEATLVGNEESIKEVCKQHGFDSFISKPIDVRYLNAALNKFVRDRHPAVQVQPKPEKEVNPKLLEAFRHDAEKAVATLRETAPNSNLKLFITTVHAMKSALANIGEMEASQSAFALENAGQNGDMEYIAAHTESFIKTLEALAKKFRRETPAVNNAANFSDDVDY